MNKVWKKWKFYHTPERIVFHPYNIYKIFNGSLVYGKISIFPNLVHWKGAFVSILILSFFCALVLFHVLYMHVVCGFSSFLSIICCLRLLIDSCSSTKAVFNIMSHMNTKFTGASCSILCLVPCTGKVKGL